MKNILSLSTNKATVLVTVIMLITAMSALAVGILSAMGSQGVFGQNQVDRIKAEQLAKGAFWKSYYEAAITGTKTPQLISETLDGKTYTAGTSISGSAGPSGTSTLTSTVSY